MMTAVVLHIWQ